MGKKVKRKGICSTCNNDSHCAFPRSSESGVVECDEFTSEYGISRLSAPEIQTSLSSRPHAMEDVPAAKGLCVNCDNLKTCTYPKPEGGVWHCEEYQ